MYSRFFYEIREYGHEFIVFLCLSNLLIYLYIN